MLRIPNRILAKFGVEIRRSRPRAVTSQPPATLAAVGRRRGAVLISYIPDDVLKDEQDVSPDHTHFWESRQMARTFAAAGFDVDVVAFNDKSVRPLREYDVLVSARTDLERLARLLPDDCLRIAHLDTAHFLTNNDNATKRLRDLRDRHGVALRNNRSVENNWALENADMGCVLGNEFTARSYAYAGKPIHRIPLSSVRSYGWDDGKDFDACRNTFLWFGSAGFAHKGLDLVIDAFEKMPDFRLVICGPVDAEERFAKAFHRQMYETDNIETVGWVDVTGPGFRDISRRCVATIYPSCSEGGGGSVITCMHAGLIPVVTEEASVDVGEFGTVLSSASAEAIREAAEDIAATDAETLERRARAAWNFAREHHTRERFAAEYEKFVSETVLPALERRGLRT